MIDYKFFCFDGDVKYCQVIANRSTNETIDFFDMDWRVQPFIGLAAHQHSKEPIVKPKNLSKMIEICKTLSQGIPFVRIDLYEINGKVYFGEITFFPASGFGMFKPDEWNYRIGDMIKLPSKKN